MPPSRVRAATLAFLLALLPTLLCGDAWAEDEREQRLPSESPCRPIRQIDVPGLAPLSLPESWAPAALAGPRGDDAPSGRCLGVTGIGILVARLQDALIARG